MKKIVLLLGFITFASALVKGQQKSSEKIKMVEVGYLTRELNLSSSEAEKFWPVYNAYKAEVREVFVENASADKTQVRKKVLEIRSKYQTKFSEILNEKRAPEVFESEKKFRSMIRKEVNDRNKSAVGRY